MNNKMKRNIVFLCLLMVGFTLHGGDVEFPLIQAMSYFPYSDNHVLGKKVYTLSLNMFYSNIYMFDYERTTVNDMELLKSTLGFRYGFSERITLELYYKMALVYGGFMDGLIENFHKLFGLKEGGRSDLPRNKVNYLYKDAFSYDKSMLVQSPLVLGVLGNLYNTENLRINGRVAVGLPIFSKFGFSSSKPFYTAGVIFLYKHKDGKLSIDFSNHLSLFANPGWLAHEEIRNHIFLSEIRVNYKSLFGGLLYRSVPFKTGELSNGAYQVYIGFRFWKRFEFSFVEEFPPLDTAPDVTLNLKILLST